MNQKLAEENNNLYQALLVGKEMKHSDNMGKEYYALYNIHGYTVLDWIENKIEELIGSACNKHVSITGIAYDLTEKNVFLVSNVDGDLIYIHKKRFKRFLKKAVQRHTLKG
ncbi:hypothetical protein PHABIO_162 [Pseudomonas phage Phabio]|uniref:Uncharacterized protein n=1 Tax=Pseudomonas phage Phabio TaxID=2006668 RepID=A0A1Y0SYH2_9CAUD|nr:hypothetical protein MZD05_gp162 [Pseudomonas phage Phabio]ARV76793.1 hypothetical protein PHABIO_162 [Pseudomonas phage Phabio]